MYVLAFIFVHDSRCFENELWIVALFFLTIHMALDLCTEDFGFCGNYRGSDLKNRTGRGRRNSQER
ncbi:protein of unknown function [Nitrospira defluvii]|uniref:Uncharacterized protein n=1 Tax=Nitrospira defluvii TaxID=330214 RepID=D8PHV2_9BACT|nr:protein of unknown function [Nitrospira defluvii]